MATLLEALRHNSCAPLAVLAVAAPFVVFGGLHLEWALLGLAATVMWAALQPVPEPSLAAPADRAGEQSVETAAVNTEAASLLGGLPDAAVLLDSQGMVAAGNGLAEVLAPIPVGRPLSQWMRAPELLGAVDRASRSVQRQRCHIRLFTPVERSLEVLVTPMPIAAAGQGAQASGEPSSLLVVLRDLTEHEQVSRMRVDFVANASHELRTPLASLRGFIETLQGAARADPAAQTRFLGIMQAQAERMSRLIDDLLSLSRIEMREHVAPTAIVDLVAVTSEVIAALRLAAEGAGVTMRATLPNEPQLLTGDRDELAQIAQNLIQNAIKYGRRGGSVSVEIRREEGQIALEVSDDGIGIGPEHLPRLTERFYRVSTKDSNERGGTGLGLAIVKHIVNRHRGELRISSVLGKGSRFCVLLPPANPRS